MGTQIVDERVAVESTKRREFLGRIVNAITGFMGFAVAIPTVRYLLPVTNQQSRAKWLDAGGIGDLKNATPRQISFEKTRRDGWKVGSERQTAWLMVNDHGELRVFSPRCTHLGCAYTWDTNTSQFVCPCHGSRFDGDGKVLTGPATRPLDRFEAKLIDRHLWLSSRTEVS